METFATPMNIYAEGGSLSRRTAVTMMTAIVAAPAAAIQPMMPPNPRAAWDAAMRTFLEAEAAADAFNPIYWKIHAAYEAARPSMDSTHWKEFRFENRDVVARTMDLDKAWTRFLDAEGRSWWASKDGSERWKARYRAALDSVQAFRDAEARHSLESGMEAAEEKGDQLTERWSEAETDLMEMPAPDLAALRWKLDKILEPDDPHGSVPPWSKQYVAQTIADYRRLLTDA